MKRNLKIFLALAVVAVLLVSAMVAVSAEEASKRVDPVSLKPTSDRVVFIMDAPDGKELEGDGTGSDFANPYITSDHDKFDPNAAHPEYYYQTSLYQATEMLGSSGGTIVICGPVRIGLMQSHGSGADTKDCYTYTWGTKQTIKFTSVYNGVDYRETNGAKLIIETPAEIGVRGASVWENIDIVTVGTKRIMSFGSFPTLMGSGINCYPEDDAYVESAANYISLSGGHRYAKGDNQIPTLTVQSGTYNMICGGIWGVTPTSEMKDATSYLTLEGKTKVLGQITGTVTQNSQFSGHVNITINGGSYPCDIYGVGPTGLVNTDGTVDIIINGGDFSECWSINQSFENAPNNLPAISILDFSEWSGSKEGLAQAYSVVTDFTEVKLPNGMTEDKLLELVEKKETETIAPEETEAPVGDDSQETEAPKNDDGNDKPSGAVDVEGNGGSSNTTLIIVIIVAVVVVAGFGTAILIVLTKKKK